MITSCLNSPMLKTAVQSVVILKFLWFWLLCIIKITHAADCSNDETTHIELYEVVLASGAMGYSANATTSTITVTEGGGGPGEASVTNDAAASHVNPGNSNGPNPAGGACGTTVTDVFYTTYTADVTITNTVLETVTMAMSAGSSVYSVTVLKSTVDSVPALGTTCSPRSPPSFTSFCLRATNIIDNPGPTPNEQAIIAQSNRMYGLLVPDGIDLPDVYVHGPGPGRRECLHHQLIRISC